MSNKDSAASEVVRDDHIWLRRTHEKDGWAFGYFSDRPQDDAFVEYARVRASVDEAVVRRIAEMIAEEPMPYNARFTSFDLRKWKIGRYAQIITTELQKGK